MQKIQYVSKYIALSEEGLVPRLECPMDQGSLLPNQGAEDNIFLYCLSCDFNKTVGFKYYDQLVKHVKEVENGS